MWNHGYEQKINNHDWGDIPKAGYRVRKKKTVLCCQCDLEKDVGDAIIKTTVWIPKKQIKGKEINGWRISSIYWMIVDFG